MRSPTDDELRELCNASKSAGTVAWLLSNGEIVYNIQDIPEYKRTILLLAKANGSRISII